MGPLSEEDVNFQFPQQQFQQSFQEPTPADATHRKGDSGEITGIMAEQVGLFFEQCAFVPNCDSKIAIQNQIEALQQQQQALYQQQLASNQVLSFQTPGLALNRNGSHRRVQSNVPVGLGNGFPSQASMNQFSGLGALGLGLDGQPQNIPRGHGRRHSVNVVNNQGNQNSLGSISYGANQFPSDQFDDGFNPPNFQGHSRQASRADSSWRISTSPHLIQWHHLQFVRWWRWWCSGWQ
jgi:protein SSD1